MGEPDKLIEILQKRGVMPLVSSTINDAVHSIANKDISAVFVDRRQTDIDVLELILNLRDVDRYTPIMVVDDPFDKHYEKEMVSQPGVHYMATEYSKLENVIENFLTDRRRSKSMETWQMRSEDEDGKQETRDGRTYPAVRRE